ncbi:hypothetical protein [Xenorhabdus ehlersii]|uniref:Uncharacterized protein n=1 Tax=Xenorhabdus ehlersii TaxID=290111 RepID=A0A2D0IKR3_9GAMM|nr:hypothetical protein [Xenorhabdus ehlersii]PHM22368.1 hypothetical protein Xehl_03712 [Xenorhabdus ehlersii]RKE90546.1 hypothetical protein BDE27_2420 [Xenorhabdus ehlersii]
MRGFGCDPCWMQDAREERDREEAAYQDATDEHLDKRADIRLGKLPDNTLSDEISSLLAMTGDKRSELMDAHYEWLFDVCRAVEEERI